MLMDICNQEYIYLMQEVLDIYTSNEPRDAFGERIGFCLKLHDDSVQALRFPSSEYKKALQAQQEKIGALTEAEYADLEDDDEMDF
jgi:26S proteasome regulatory subunit N3